MKERICTKPGHEAESWVLVAYRPKMCNNSVRLKNTLEIMLWSLVWDSVNKHQV